MSASIDIPTKRSAKGKHPEVYTPIKSSTGSSPSSYLGSSMGSPASASSSMATPIPLSLEEQARARRPSLLSAALAKQEATVINIGDPDGPPRLISYLSSSQGYQWNPEIFLPSYLDYDYTPLEHRREPVHDIILTDEEIAQLLPQ